MRRADVKAKRLCYRATYIFEAKEKSKAAAEPFKLYAAS